MANTEIIRKIEKINDRLGNLERDMVAPISAGYANPKTAAYYIAVEIGKLRDDLTKLRQDIQFA